MVSTKTLERISALCLNEPLQVIIIDIVREAIDDAQPKGRALAKTAPADWPTDYHEQFWGRYPSRKAKAAAMKALDKVAFAGKTAWVDLIRGLERYISSETVRRGFVKHPATWLNAECWKDEDGPEDSPNRPTRTKNGGPGFFEIAAGLDK